jgi:creatinine amidohydrolase
MKVKLSLSLLMATMCCVGASALPKVLLWDKLSIDEFYEARELTKGTVIVPIGCVEKHGRHLPLGTDSLCGMYICEKVCEIEPVLIYNIGNLGAVWESKHWLGAVAIKHDTLLSVLDDLCNEFARNGCTNVILSSYHGGNGAFLQSFVRSRLEKPIKYNLYYFDERLSRAQYAEWHKRFGKMPIYGHAGIYETSLMLHAYPELVNMSKVSVEESTPKFRQKDMRSVCVYTPIDWYAECDTQWYGDPTNASKEMGEFVMSMHITNHVNAVRKIKTDSLMPALQAEFDKHCENPQR